MDEAMYFKKAICCAVIALMIAASCYGFPNSNNEVRGSDPSENNSPVQQPQDADVNRRSSKSEKCNAESDKSCNKHCKKHGYPGGKCEEKFIMIGRKNCKCDPNTVDDCLDRSRQCYYYYGKKGCNKDLYKGSRSYTASGIKCQEWSSDKPHSHSHSSLPSNYCRNPSGAKGPWCYTMNPVKEWDYCFIDCSAKKCFDDNRKCFHYGKEGCSNQYVYNGTRSYTKDGIMCQEWSANKPESHEYSYLPKSYCRNPNGKDGPWCYSTKPIKEVTGDVVTKNWDYCLADCAVHSCFKTRGRRKCFYRGKEGCSKPYVYNGTMNFSLGGNEDTKMCMKWSIFGYDHLPENYCRNPRGGVAPWCYTGKKEKIWEWNYCFIDCYKCWAKCKNDTIGNVQVGTIDNPSNVCDQLVALKTCATSKCSPYGARLWKRYIRLYKISNPTSCKWVN